MILYKGLTMRMNDVLGCFLSLVQWGTDQSAVDTFQTILIKANVEPQKEVQGNLTFSVSLFITKPDPLNPFHSQAILNDIIFSLPMNVSYSHFFPIDHLSLYFIIHVSILLFLYFTFSPIYENLFLQQITECLLCAKHCAGCGMYRHYFSIIFICQQGETSVNNY